MVGRPRGRGGRVGGRVVGRVGGRGRVLRNAREPVAEESVAQGATVEQVAYSQADMVGSESVAGTGAGGAGTDVGVAGGPAVAAGVAAGGDQARDDRLADLLTLLLERLPERVPARAPEVPLVVEVQPRVAEQPRVAVAGELPSYLKMMEQLQRLGTKFFCGGARPVESDEWRSRLERNFQSIRCPVEYRVDLVMRISGGGVWQPENSDRDGLGRIFVKELTSSYFTQEAFNRLESRLASLTQGDRSVRVNEVELNRLGTYVRRAVESGSARGQRILMGLSRGNRPMQGQKRKRKPENASRGSRGGPGCFGRGNMDHRAASYPQKEFRLI